jgi:cytokinin dehydrogenase
MPATLDDAALAARAAGVSYYADAAIRASAETDFGGVARGSCLLVAEPTGAEECARLVEALGARDIGCSLRGAGYGQGGQAVAQNTVSVSTRRLDWIGPVDAAGRNVTVGAGATLRRVLLALRGSGVAPPALPLNLDVSVGGVLSAGGIGSASHRHGPLAANVLQLDVVTGAGELRPCTPAVDADLFDGALAGLGQFGLIAQATLALRQAPRRMRTFAFLYNDAEGWLRDQLLAADAGAEMEIEGFCFAAARGVRSTPAGPVPYTHWTYGLHLATDAAPARDHALRNLLDSLRPSAKLDEGEVDHLTYLRRYEPRFSGMVQSGAWYEPHPWFEGMVPLDGALDVLRRILEMLPSEVGDGHRFMLLDSGRSPSSLALRGVRPGVNHGANRVALIGVFPVAFARTALPKVLRSVDQVTAAVLEAKGRRYLSGWLGSDAPGYFRAHFGEQHEKWLNTRRKYDPRGVLRSSLFPQGNRD